MNWKYDEYVLTGTDYTDEAQVRQYDERMGGFRDFAAENARALEALSVQPGRRVLDIGCGTGRFALAAAAAGAEVVALDISEPMLGYARTRAVEEGLTNIRFEKSGFLDVTPELGVFYAVHSSLVLHHLPDFWKQIALCNIAAVLKKGGGFFLRDVVFSLRLEKYAQTVSFEIEALRAKGGEAMGGAFARHVAREYSTWDWIMEEMVYRAGLMPEAADYGDSFIAEYVCRKVEMPV
jgi:ubiquinone/menaquinone biosynthesis C-methylase UbiE